MFAAVDIGGTKTLVAVFDSTGKITEQQKFPTPPDYEIFKAELAQVLARFSTSDFLKCVVALPGLIDRKHGVGISCGNLTWRNVPVQADIEHIFRCPVMVENDAKLAGLSEALLVQKTYKRVLYVTLSTGIGISVIEDGIIDTDIGDSGGNNIILERKGKQESWEHFASGSAIVRRFGKRASEIEDSKTWKIIAHDIALGLRDVIAILEPDVVIIGGGVGTHFAKYGEFLTTELKRYETPLSPIPPIVQAQHSEEAVIYGCYNYAKQHHEKLTRS